MPTLQPTQSDMRVRSTNTSTAAFQLWADWFDTVATHWEVVEAFGVNGGDGFTLRQLAGDTTTKYLLQRSSDSLNILIDPSGSVSLQDGSNASAFSSPLKFVFSCGASAFQNEWQFHEWDDHFSVFNVYRVDPICDMPVNIQAGYIMTPALGSDPGHGMTGLGILGGVTNTTNGANNMWTTTAVTPSMLKVANNGDSGDWVEIYGGFGNGGYAMSSNTSNNTIADRDQPHALGCMVKPNNRLVGLYKYIYGYGVTNQSPGNVLVSGGVSKFQYVGAVNSSGYVTVVPIQDNFDPSAPPTNI